MANRKIVIVTDETHKKLKDRAKKTGLKMEALTEKLITIGLTETKKEK